VTAVERKTMNMYAACLLLVLVMIGCAPAAVAGEGKTGSWGDQEDGTYRNPVLNADFPDSDTVEHDGTYYMISSKQHMSPGMVILESKDLVNWRLRGHVFDRLSWEPTYDPDRMSGYRFGVWAGDLAHHDGRWYCYQIDFKSGLYMTSAADLDGPWDKPICMLRKQHWTDPAVFWDDDAKQAYLVCNFGNTQGKGNEIRLFKMSWDGKRLLDKGKPIYTAPGAEAAKIEKIDGKWLIMLAEWREQDRKQVVLRSKTDSIYGPYERKVVMEKGNGVHRSVCQGSLLQAPDGSWWFIHQLVQARGKRKGDLAGPQTGASFEGRSQWLEPVTWVDGWPIIGKDIDGDGIGEPVRSGRKPVAGQPVSAPQTDDEFDAPTLGPQWEWNHNPRDNRWSLTERKGWLRLKASVPVGKGGFWGACNTVSQRLMGKGKGTVNAKIDLSGMKPGQRAGFARFSDVYHLLGVRVDEAGARRLFFSANGKVTDGPAVAGDTLHVRTFNDANQARYEYSTDGRTFTRVGPTFTIRFGNWCGDRLGFFCWNTRAAAGHIDVDYFRYDYDGPKAAK